MDNKDTGSSGWNKIDINENYRLRDWSGKFGVTAQDSIKAVEAVSTSVKRHLKE